MANPEDSNVLRQLIDQIEGELSTFNGVSGGGSDQSLSSFASQGSLAPSENEGSRSASVLSMPSKGQVGQRRHSLYDLQLPVPPQQQQQQPFPSTATSAIFGTAFERPVQQAPELPQQQQQHQQQQQQQQPAFGSTSLVVSGSYFMGPRAPQYIPSPLTSPVSPGLGETPVSGVEKDGGSNDSFSETQRTQLKPPLSQGSLSAVAADILQVYHREGNALQSVDAVVDVLADFNGVEHEETTSRNISPENQQYNDNIKVDVTELYENFGQKKPSTAEQEQLLARQDDEKGYELDGRWIGGRAATIDTLLSSSLPLKLPELSFSSNDLTSLWTPGATDSSLVANFGSDGEKRSRLHTFHGQSKASQERDQLASSSTSSLESNSSKQSVAFPPRQSSPLEADYLPPTDSTQEPPSDADTNESVANDNTGAAVMEAGGPNEGQTHLRDHPRSDRKRLSLVTSGVGLAAASAAVASQGNLAASGSKIGRSVLDLPTWDLAPLSPPVEVKETIPASTTVSPMNARRGSMNQQQQRQDSPSGENHHLNGIMSPTSATLMTPTTPLTTREARILAGREALLRMSPDKHRVQRGLSASSTASSIASSLGRPASATSGGDGQDTETLTDAQDARRRGSVNSHNSQQSQPAQINGGINGAVPERGQLADVPQEKLMFPDQSIRPVPLKAYRVRKLTLKERNQTYAQACEEFTRARTGLDVWALRCMMQDRPALMKDPPAIIKAVGGKYTSGSGHQAENQSRSHGTTGHMTPTASQFSNPMISSISGGHGIGARIKNAGKRLSMDVSGPHSTTPENTGQGSLFYKQKSTKSAVELGSWSSGRARGISNTDVNAGTPPPPQGTSGHRNSIGGLMASSSPQQEQQHLRGGPFGSPASGSMYLSQGKRNSIAVINSPLSNSLRSRTMSDVQSGSRMSMVGRETPATRNSGSNSRSHQHQDIVSSPIAYSAAGGPSHLPPSSSSYTGAPLSATFSVFMERPIQRSLSTHYTRKPASMMAVPNQRPGLTHDSGSNSASNISMGSQSSSSLGSVSSNSVADSLELKTSSTTSSLTSGLIQQQLQQQQSLLQEAAAAAAATAGNSGSKIQLEYTYNTDGTPIPYADETKSKDEMYSPLTSPIMIPIGGFPAPKPSHNNGSYNGGWTSPQSADGGGLTRPLTYAGPSSSTLGSNSSLIMSPSSANKDYSQPPLQQHQQQGFARGYGSPALERGNTGSTVEPMQEKTDKSSRYSTSSFSSISSFARNQKRSSKKDRKKELLEEQQLLQQQQQQHSLKQQQLDQRYSVSSASVNQSIASATDFWTEQSLDKLSDVLPHVDRDRLSIYLQRAYGDEMVAIGLAMSDFRSGQL